MSDIENKLQELEQPVAQPKKIEKMSLRKQRMFLFGVMFVILVVLAVVVFLTPKKLFEVVVEPESIADNVEVDSITGRTIRFGSQIALYSEDAKLEVSHPGYVSQIVNLHEVEGPTLHVVELQPLPGYLDINLTGDLDVVVTVNNQTVTQLKGIQLEAGTYNVALSYQSIFLDSESIDVEGFGEQYEVNFDLSQYGASIQLSADPKSATITLDDKVPVSGQLSGGISVGAHKISIEHPWFLTATLNFIAEVGDVVQLGTVTLKPKPILARITSNPKGASILVNDEYVGETDLSMTLLTNRQYEIKAIKPGYAQRRAVINTRIGQSIQRHFDFVQNTISVSVSVQPNGTIYVNGMLKGETPQNLEVYPGDEIEARSPGRVPKVNVVDLAEGTDQTIAFELFNPVDHAYREAPKELKVQGNMTLVKFPAMKFDKLIEVNRDRYLTIDINRPFYLGTHEVTAEQYHLYRKTTQTNDRKPITKVSWLSAIGFCNWLSKQSNLEPVYVLKPSGLLDTVDIQALGFRLPTEHEWEAGASYIWQVSELNQPYEWGAQPAIPIGFANLAGRERSVISINYMEDHADNHERAAPVGSYLPNANGLFDMSGNVSEWVHDQFIPRRPTDLPVGYFDPRSGLTRTVKGGNYTTHELEEVMIHHRDFGDSTSPTLGFRVARWIH